MSSPSWVGRPIGGRYQIDALLGQGGMSAVYRATDPNLRRTVAVKLIHPHLSNDPEFVRRFEQEAAAVAQLRHPNIIQVYDFNHDGEVYYMVLEFVAGETLQHRLRTMHAANQSMPLGEAVLIMATIAEAVEYAHRRGMIHRDLKPANVMLTPEGQPILMDFGVAKIVGGQQHTATGAIVGTVAYMRKVYFPRAVLPVAVVLSQLVHLAMGLGVLLVPLALRNAGLPGHQHWEVYLPVLVCSMAAIVPFVIIAEKYRRLKSVFLGAILTLALTEFGLLVLHDTVLETAVLLLVFFTGFNLLEATLPSLIAKMAPPDAKGTAMGIYSSSQFLGAFAGGALGGWLRGLYDSRGVFAFAALAALAWLMRRRLGGLALTRMWPGLWRTALATGVMGAGLLAWSAWTSGASPWLAGLGGVAVGGGLFWLIAYALRSPEARQFSEMALRQVAALLSRSG